MTDGKLTPWALRDIIVTELRTYSESVNPTEPAALLEWEIEMLADRILDRARGASIKPVAIGAGQQAERTDARFVELSEKNDAATEDGVRNIEVTPEMVEAGFDALTSFDSRDYPSRAMVMAVFDAMLAALPRPILGSSES